MNILVCSLTGMAELHPEECRSRFYRVGQRRQVGHAHLPRAVFFLLTASLHYLSNLYPPATFLISPFFHHITVPQGPCDRVAISDSGPKSMMVGGA